MADTIITQPKYGCHNRQLKMSYQTLVRDINSAESLVEELPNSGCLTRPLTAEDVALLMIQVKASRLANLPTHEDSWIDIAGYVNCVSQIQQGE